MMYNNINNIYYNYYFGIIDDVSLCTPPGTGSYIAVVYIPLPR
jgi:hypothetical protein